MDFGKEDTARRHQVDWGTSVKPARILRSSAKPLKDTTRIKIPIKIERTKPLSDLTPDDIPPGFSPEDMATDGE